MASQSRLYLQHKGYALSSVFHLFKNYCFISLDSSIQVFCWALVWALPLLSQFFSPISFFPRDTISGTLHGLIFMIEAVGIGNMLMYSFFSNDLVAYVSKVRGYAP